MDIICYLVTINDHSMVIDSHLVPKPFASQSAGAEKMQIIPGIRWGRIKNIGNHWNRATNVDDVSKSRLLAHLRCWRWKDI